MLHIKQLNSKKTRFLRFDKILVIQPIAEVYGEGSERQLCWEIETYLDSLPNDKQNLLSSTLKTFKDDKTNVIRKRNVRLAENIVGKDENIAYQHILLFHNVFSLSELYKVRFLL